MPVVNYTSGIIPEVYLSNLNTFYYGRASLTISEGRIVISSDDSETLKEIWDRINSIRDSIITNKIINMEETIDSLQETIDKLRQENNSLRTKLCKVDTATQLSDLAFMETPTIKSTPLVVDKSTPIFTFTSSSSSSSAMPSENPFSQPKVLRCCKIYKRNHGPYSKGEQCRNESEPNFPYCKTHNF